jgi:hypothetical protein
MSNTIEFFCYERDKPLEIQLEPEAIIFIASPENALKFVATNAASDFRWSLRIIHEGEGVQLFPDSLGEYEIEIYENNQLLDDWYKYM